MDAKRIFERDDGLARVLVYASATGSFTFSEESWEHDDAGYDYWLPAYHGGLYASLEEAEADARATVRWLRGGSSS
jgi:hypothetical protein